MRYFRGGNSPNALVAIFLLVLLAIFAGPNMLPNLLPTILPGADESIPCHWLRTGDNRAEHQSLIGRSVTNPISLSVRPSPLPQQPGGVLDIAIIITNHSIGTVAIYYNPTNRLLVGDDGQTSGLGLVFNRSTPLGLGSRSGGSYPEDEIRLLGPRQSCVHHETYSFEQIPQLGLSLAENTVKAYYRNNSSGTSQLTNGSTQMIYPDQGLWVGIAESTSARIALPSG